MKKERIKVDLSLSLSTVRYLDVNPKHMVDGEYIQEYLLDTYLKMDKSLKVLLQSGAWVIDDYNVILQNKEKEDADI